MQHNITNVSAKDTIPVTATDSTVTPPRAYYLGKVIPVDSTGLSFPDTMATSNQVYSRVYTKESRFKGDRIAEKPLNNNFAFGVIIFCTFILALISIPGRRSLNNTLSSLRIKRPYVPPVPGAYGAISWVPSLTNIFSMLNIALFVVAGGVTTGMLGDLPGIETIKYTGLIFGALMVVLLLRYFICRVTGNLSNNKKAFVEYRAVINATWFLTGVSSFVCTIIILFTTIETPDYLVWSNAGIFALIYFYRIIRLLIIFIKQHISILYFILYLCALEVLPVLIVLKLLGVF